MHHPIFRRRDFRGKNQAKFSFVVQLLAGYIYVYVAVMAMSGAVTIGDVLMYSGAIITMMTGVQNVLMQYNQINYRNEYLKTYEEFINRPNMHYDGTLPIEKRDDNEYELILPQCVILLSGHRRLYSEKCQSGF